jgi:hypothetical protein
VRRCDVLADVIFGDDAQHFGRGMSQQTPQQLRACKPRSTEQRNLGFGHPD